MVAFWRFVTIVLSALALTMTSAHVLELPQKMRYTAEMYTAVNTTLYRYFAIIGGPYQIGAIASAIVLTVLVRRQSVIFRWTLVGTVLLIAAFVSWLILVLPVNREVAAALEASPQTVPMLWLRLRDRWEYGHATGFVLHLAGFCVLVMSVVRDVRPRAGDYASNHLQD
jgi:MFS family permease